MAAVFDYIVIVAATHPTTGDKQEYTIQNEAYNIDEALRQAFFEIDAKYNVITQQYKLKVVSIGPDTTKFKDRIEKHLQEIGLLALPTQGSKS